MSTDEHGVAGAVDLLACAVTASEAAAQAAGGLWATMSDDERAAWLAAWSTRYPRLDLYLPIVIVAAERAVDADREHD